MRERVQKIAREMGYRPDATVASLMAQLRSQKTTLGFLNASENPAILDEIATFQEWSRGASSRATELGYGMDFFWLHEAGLTPSRLRQILIARGIRGLIVAALQNDGVLPAAYRELWSDFSCIIIGMRPKKPALHFTANDQFSTAAHAVEELRGLGYKRIGLVINSKIDAWLEHRFSAGFFADHIGTTEDRLPVFDFEKDEPVAFQNWFRINRPDAIVTLHSEIRSWLERSDRKTSGDPGLVHLDREMEMTDWAGMNQNSYCIGVAATEMIVGQLHRNEQGVPDFPKAILIQSNWIPGASARSRKKKNPRARRGFSEKER